MFTLWTAGGRCWLSEAGQRRSAKVASFMVGLMTSLSPNCHHHQHQPQSPESGHFTFPPPPLPSLASSLNTQNLFLLLIGLSPLPYQGHEQTSQSADFWWFPHIHQSLATRHNSQSVTGVENHSSVNILNSQFPRLDLIYLTKQCVEDSEPLHVCRKGVPCKTKAGFSPDVPSSSELVRTSKTIQLLLWERRELINPVTQLTRGVSQNVCIFKFDCIWASVCDWGNCQYSSRKLIYWSFYTSQLERFESWRMKMFASLEVWYPKFPLIRNLFWYSLHTLQCLVHPGPTQYAGL